jgi:hypothetical protein
VRALHRRATSALIAMLLVIGLAACGGDDEPAEGGAVTVTEQVTVTAGDGGTPPAGDQDAAEPLAGDEIDQAVAVYRQFFGFTEEQARCVITRAQELSEFDSGDPSAFITAGGLQIFQDCGIDLAEFAGRFGTQP